jgi:hypothetical protein
MSNWYGKGSAGVALAAVLAVAPAQAALIDFTDGGWSTANPRMYGGIEVTLYAFDENSNFVGFTETPFDGDIAQCGPLALACESDGIGIGDDEVSFGNQSGANTPKEEVERLVVQFSTAVDIDSVVFLDLFSQASSTDTPAEVAQFQVNGNGAGGGFTGTAADRTGFFVGTAGNADPISDPEAFLGVTQIEFFADTLRLSSPDNSDFSLAAIRTAVPAPGVLALLGIGLLGLGLGAKRRMG